jgi:DNA-binding transcriptional ArsR family regulator
MYAMARSSVTVPNRGDSPPAALPDSLDDMRQHASDAESLLKALANRNRLLILCTLAGGEMSVSALNEHVPLGQSALSQHLAVLRALCIVTFRRESQTIYYSLAEGPAAAVMATLHAVYCAPQSKGAARRTGKSRGG